MTRRALRIPALLVAASSLAAAALPQRYFELMESGAVRVKARLDSEANPTLASIETGAEWKHFGYAILAPAVLYAVRHPANRRYRDPEMLALAVRVGDLLAAENAKGNFTPRLDSDWDTYVWLEAWRLLERDLGAARKEVWKRALLENIAPLEDGAAERVDFPWYESPFIGTSPNHYSQWAELLFLAGRTFDRPKWTALGASILHRFLVDQTPDGFWGEHSHAGPTTGYDHLTLSAVGVYCELSGDPLCAAALRRSLNFHENFTYPNGMPVETINDRNRYWEAPSWGQFAFSTFPDGRRFADFLTGFFDPQKLSMSDLGRIAQNALYYHEGPQAPIPQDRDRYAYSMQVPASIRKTGPWVVSLSGIIATQAPTNQYYLDRQSNLSVVHARLGPIVSGANSKRQPELATFREKIEGTTYALAQTSRLQMSDSGDRLSVAFSTFFTDIYVDPPTPEEARFRFVIAGRGNPPEEAFTTLQLVLHPGEMLETGTRSVRVSSEPVRLGPEELGGVVQHHGWKLQTDAAASLVWPVYPYNPYLNGPETNLEHAVAALSIPLRLKSLPGHYVRPHEQQIEFRLSAR